MDIIVDPRLYLLTKGKMFMGNKKRAMPDAFKIFMGKFLTILIQFPLNYARRLYKYTITERLLKRPRVTIVENYSDLIQINTARLIFCISYHRNIAF